MTYISTTCAEVIIEVKVSVIDRQLMVQTVSSFLSVIN